jgi:hypothetical protein
MPHAAVAGNVAKPRNVLAHLATQLTFNRVVLVEQGGQPGHLVLAQLARSHGRVDARLVAQLTRRFRTDAVKVRKGDHRLAISRNVDA